MTVTAERSAALVNGHAANLVPPGFADPVLDSQAAFRSIMDASARPGTIVDAGSNLPAFDGIDPAALCFLMALCDHETSLWLGSDRDHAAVFRYLKFHTGAGAARRPADAHFALITEPGHLPPLVTFATGDPEFPERSATILIQVPDLTSGLPLRIAAPGIRDKITINVAGLDLRFWSAFAANRGLYPCGVDVILTARERLMALPRSVIVEL
ncbi:MAG: phosphonate C-P lyase system protein PhnH [Rhodospirillales bacterium]|nr:MAG: phosphonate C-P lyase system protein PhnH [Rhodospirillales bacterium]